MLSYVLKKDRNFELKQMSIENSSNWLYYKLELYLERWENAFGQKNDKQIFIRPTIHKTCSASNGTCIGWK